MDEDGWDSDDTLRAAVLQQLTTIGEASRSVSNQLRERHSDVPWRRIADFRNVAVHQYFTIEWSLVWRLVRDRVATLRPQIRLQHTDLSDLKSETSSLFLELPEEIQAYQRILTTLTP
ncbi:MAG: HepT-like ribonuclease domain-containing protein [Pseudonocardiaceae bacterium]